MGGTMRKVWIEAALNGAWSRALQPGIPDTIESMQVERAGAAIIHTHAYHNGGSQTFDWQVYARIIEGIREQVEVPVYPSYPAILTSGTDATHHRTMSRPASPISKPWQLGACSSSR